jgi:hypothetical protein
MDEGEDEGEQRKKYQYILSAEDFLRSHFPEESGAS